jgi:uncharacterized membrane protein
VSAAQSESDAQRPTTPEEFSRMIADRLDAIARDYATQLGDLREQLGRERERSERLEAELSELRKAREAPESAFGSWPRGGSSRPPGRRPGAGR